MKPDQLIHLAKWSICKTSCVILYKVALLSIIHSEVLHYISYTIKKRFPDRACVGSTKVMGLIPGEHTYC